MPHTRAETGQASVELVAVFPLIAVVAMLLWQAVVAGQAVWLAGSAARAAARAVAVGRDPQAAARAMLPPGLRGGARVAREPGGAVRLRLRIPVVGTSSWDLGSVTARARLEQPW